MEDKNQQEDEKQDIKFQLSQKAREILEEPLIKSFFEIKENEPLEALKQLDPAIAELKDYMVIHHNLLAMLTLRASLKQYVQDYELERFTEEQEEESEEEETVNI